MYLPTYNLSLPRSLVTPKWSPVSCKLAPPSYHENNCIRTLIRKTKSLIQIRKGLPIKHIVIPMNKIILCLQTDINQNLRRNAQISNDSIRSMQSFTAIKPSGSCFFPESLQTSNKRVLEKIFLKFLRCGIFIYAHLQFI